MLKKMMVRPDPLVEQTDADVHAIFGDGDDEEEETLSLCEFSFNSESDLWGNSSRESSQNSSFKSSEEEDCFEFFSQEGSVGGSSFSSNSNPPSENIIFCGKLISYKEPTSENTGNINNIKFRKHKMRRGIFRWKWNYFFSSHKTRSEKKSSKSIGRDQEKESSSSGRYKSLTAQPQLTTTQKRSNARKRSNKEHDLSFHKMTLLTSSLAKSSSRWHLLFFGTTKHRTKINLRDMKLRQTRNRRSSSFHNESSGVCINKSKGFWAVLRALSCSTGDHPVDVLV